MDELLEAALNTYRVLIMNEDPFDIIDKKGGAFLLDVSDHPYIDYKSRIAAAENSIDILEEFEHYEKCADLQEYIKDIDYEVQGLSE